MKRLLLSLFTLLLLPSLVLAQTDMEWESAGVFPPDTLKGVNNGHGLAVDGFDKVWMASYYASEEIGEGEEAIATRAIYVYDEDGTPTSFSPITMLTLDGVTDTLLVPTTGLVSDHNGNILYTNAAGVMYRIDAETGEPMDRVQVFDPEVVDRPDLTAPSVSASGEIVVTTVFPGNPIAVYDAEFNFLENVTTEKAGFARTILFGSDGLSVYYPAYSESAVMLYTKEDEFGQFSAVPDTVLKGMAVESIALHPVTGHLWAAAGSPNDVPNRWPGVESNYRSNVWYAFEPASLDGEDAAVPVDSMAWPTCESWDAAMVCEQSQGRPRGLAFNPAGDVAYVAQFSNPGEETFYKLIQVESSSIDQAELPEGFALEQNYPNPFTGETQITFSLHRAGHVSLQVYDVLGRQVATLLDQPMTAGTEHRVAFSGEDLPAGVYLYSLRTDGFQVQRKMMLVK